MAEVTIDEAAIRAAVNNPGGEVAREMRRRAQNVAAEAQRRAPRDTGRLVRSIQVDGPQQGQLGIEFFVLAAVNYAVFVHEGRGPGRMPPSSALAGWANRHGAAGAEFVIARAIGARGIEGKPFLADAVRAALD